MAEPIYRRLYPQVLAGMIAGVAVGFLWPEAGAALRPLGDGFVKLVKMLIGPIIFCTVVGGIAGMRDLKRVGLVGLKAAVYFEAVTTLALLIGLAVVHTIRPGAGMNADLGRLDTGAVAAYAHPAHAQGAVEVLLAVIPETAVDAFARGDILQVLFFAILFGAALARLGPRGHALAATIDDVGHVIFGIVAIVMRLAPIGAFGAMAFTVGVYGIEALAPLGKLMGCFYATCLLFVGVVLGAICRAIGIRIVPLLRYLREELLIVLGTASSESVLPRIMTRLEALGASRPVVGLVVPAGYSFNLDGTAIYLTMAAIFIAQATNTDLSVRQEVTLLAVLLVSSKGAAGVTGSGFVTLAATLAAVPTIPVAGLALILGVDRFMSEARALTNLVGNCVATLAIARWEGDLDVARARAVLGDGGPPDPAQS